MTGHSTWNALRSQPDAWQQLLTRLGRQRPLLNRLRDDREEILLIGSGSSYYLALAVAHWAEQRSPAMVWASPSCEVLLDPGRFPRRAASRRRLAFVLSRSGETTEALLAVPALKNAGYSIVSVSCEPESALIRAGDESLIVEEGREPSLVMLGGFTCMLIALQSCFADSTDFEALSALPQLGRSFLANHEQETQTFARSRAFDRFVFLGSGSAYPLAREAALKVQEMAGVTTEAYHTLEYRHGPKTTATSRTLVTMFGSSDTLRAAALAKEVGQLGAAVLIVGGEAAPYRGSADLVVPLSAADANAAQSSAALLPAQIVAFETAIRLGRDPDAPAHLSRVVVL